MKYIIIGLMMICSVMIDARVKNQSYFKYVPRNSRVTTVMKDPYIAKISNFVNDEEIAELKSLAEPLLEHSITGAGKQNTHRTSSSAFLNTCNSPVVKKIEERAARMLGVPVEHVEGLQVVHYKAGQEYKYHYDYYPKDYEKEAGSQRVYTFFVYLNDLNDDQKGGTEFPELHLTIKPCKGTAAFWRNTKEEGEGDPRMLHAGLPVAYGEKWGANIWIHDRAPKR
jgi:prolyl 4-hydroxylase